MDSAAPLPPTIAPQTRTEVPRPDAIPGIVTREAPRVRFRIRWRSAECFRIQPGLEG
ncbi:MAG: hypothetical protein HY748_05600 [Elusimicrobia bacterium]|nr:hypothetical protein [Elusimicrobiota bacterium]